MEGKGVPLRKREATLPQHARTAVKYQTQTFPWTHLFIYVTSLKDPHSLFHRDRPMGAFESGCSIPTGFPVSYFSLRATKRLGVGNSHKTDTLH